MLGSVQPPSHPSAIHRCAAFASAAKSKGAPRVRVRRRVAAEASQGRVRGMRKRADREEGEEVVTAWRVVKRRMAEGDSGGKGRRGTAGGGREVGRNGIRVEGRLRECRRGLRGDEHGLGRRASRGPRRSRSSRFLSRHRFIFFLSLPSLPRVFFVPVSIPISLSLSLALSPSTSRFLAPPSLSVPAITFSLSRVLSLSFSSARAVYSAVNGQAWSTDPRMACSCLLTPRTSPLPLIHRLSCLPSLFHFRY